MKHQTDYDLILNHISTAESMLFQGEGFEDYKQVAYLFLNHKDKGMFEDEILNEFREGTTLEKILSQNPDQYIPGIKKERNGKRENIWYDLWCMEEVEREDSFFDYFFALKLRHIDLLEIDSFLNYHLEKNFENERLKFLRFLNITTRKYEQKFLNTKVIDTINEWIQLSETTLELNKEVEKTDTIKGRIQREHGDKLTSLSLVQTALLIQYMQEARMILKGDNLTFTQAGKAFNILTGYSLHTIRHQLGSKGDLEGVKHEDYKELHEAILELAKLIEPKILKK